MIKVLELFYLGKPTINLYHFRGLPHALLIFLCFNLNFF